MKRIILIFLLLSCNKVIRDINFKTKDINEDLVLAIINNYEYKALSLIKNGANINYIHNNKTILELCLDAEYLNIIKALLEKGVEVKNDDIVRIYDIALEESNYDVINLMKDKYKLEEGLIDDNKYFLLLCYTSNAEEVKRFIEKNKIEAEKLGDERNRNAMNIAALGSKTDIFKMLFEDYKLDVDYKDDYGVSSLIIASIENNIELVKFIVRKSADIDSIDYKYCTALIYASEKGYKEIVELLLENGANVNRKGTYVFTALMKASEHGHREIVEILLEKGADIDFANDKCCTALMKASEYGHKEIVEILLEKGASINLTDYKYCTSLMKASEHGHKEIVEILLEKGANINAKNSEGSSLIISSRCGHIELIKLLIERGASIYEKDKFDKTIIGYIGEHLRNSKKSLSKNKLIEIGYMIIRKIAEDYIDLFISLNKNIETPEEIKDDIHNYISLLYSLQNLPIELFEEIIRKF